jgi:hypothetical protein
MAGHRGYEAFPILTPLCWTIIWMKNNSNEVYIEVGHVALKCGVYLSSAIRQLHLPPTLGRKVPSRAPSPSLPFPPRQSREGPALVSKEYVNNRTKSR